MASIGLTIPIVALASIWLPGSLVLGLSSQQIVLLVLTVVVGALTVLPGPCDGPGGRHPPGRLRLLPPPRGEPVSATGNLPV
jgi:hypothetical protein